MNKGKVRLRNPDGTFAGHPHLKHARKPDEYFRQGAFPSNPEHLRKARAEIAYGHALGNVAGTGWDRFSGH